MADLVGTTIANKYRVKRRIGAGGMGAVYEGEHVEIGKRVAIKVIEGEHARSPELAARFKREARAASAVESEHILHVFDVGTDDAAGLYMVMEFLVGEDLASRLEKRGGRLPVDEAMTIALQASRGLTKAHAAGVVHRDLKPANLFLTEREDGTTCVKILDFGISKLVRPDAQGAQHSSLTREGSVMGTPMYMSPQQAQGMAVDHRTDLWSLGAVIYEMLAGKPPFEPKDTYEMMIVQIVTKRPAPLAEAAPWVSRDIAAVVDATLAHEAEDRTPDAATLTKALAEAAKMPARSSRDVAVHAETIRAEAPAATGASHASPATSAGVEVRTATKPPTTSRTPIVVAGLVGVGLVVAIAVVVTRPKSEPTPDVPASLGLVQPAPSSEPATPPKAPLPDLSAEPAAPASTADAAPPAIAKTAAPAKRIDKPSQPRPANPQYGGAGLDTTYK